MSIQPKALRLADALDAEFVQGRISNSTGRESAVELRRLALKQWVWLTDEEIDALSQARSLTDELMDCVDRLGSEADTVDPRVWQHLLVYAPKPEEEPVAWISERENLLSWDKFYDHMKPLYTSPPKKEWVGLTDEEIHDLIYLSQKIDASNSPWFDCLGFYRAVEQALREKNHG